MIKLKEVILSIINCRIQWAAWILAGIIFVVLCVIFGYFQVDIKSSEFAANNPFDYISDIISYIFLGIVLGTTVMFTWKSYSQANDRRIVYDRQLEESLGLLFIGDLSDINNKWDKLKWKIDYGFSTMYQKKSIDYIKKKIEIVLADTDIVMFLILDGLNRIKNNDSEIVAISDELKKAEIEKIIQNYNDNLTLMPDKKYAIVLVVKKNNTVLQSSVKEIMELVRMNGKSDIKGYITI